VVWSVCTGMVGKFHLAVLALGRITCLKSAHRGTGATDLRSPLPLCRQQHRHGAEVFPFRQGFTVRAATSPTHPDSDVDQRKRLCFERPRRPVWPTIIQINNRCIVAGRPLPAPGSFEENVATCAAVQYRGLPLRVVRRPNSVVGLNSRQRVEAQSMEC